MNIIYEVDNKNLRFIGFMPKDTYQLNDLNFYIPKQYGNLTPFLLIKDTEGKKDILRLTQIKKDKVYNVYAVDVSNTISLNAGAASIALLTLSNNVEVSNSQNLFLSFDDFKIGKQISLIEGLSRNLAVMYEKVERMTKMNIQLYQDIEEALD